MFNVRFGPSTEVDYANLTVSFFRIVVGYSKLIIVCNGPKLVTQV